jgi:hypothetical protein
VVGADIGHARLPVLLQVAVEGAAMVSPLAVGVGFELVRGIGRGRLARLALGIVVREEPLGPAGRGRLPVLSADPRLLLIDQEIVSELVGVQARMVRCDLVGADGQVLR